eukprot:CAMPEP_0177767756 /NCGR_PEP_ID=MMETSP0491_2-20121128/9316_1 /TAXON_ID=63592 /ORGANISM="Tetraselmis chuii, Strain PLY429" /LENGTH=651 /DNA_ID=CAMNT_0019284435 /DNA_START=185 /DNA_END=2140 /DNA_ORIENTATION=-
MIDMNTAGEYNRRHRRAPGMPATQVQRHRAIDLGKGEGRWGVMLPDLVVDVVFAALDHRDAGSARLACRSWLFAVNGARQSLRIHLEENRLRSDWLSGFTRLTSLKLYGSYLGDGVRDSDLEALKQAVQGVRESRRHTDVHYSEHGGGKSPNSPSLSAFGSAGKPWLTSLDLSDCRTVSESGLGAALPCLAAGLTSLDLSGCEGVTDSSLPFIGALPRLRSLSLSGCAAVTDVGLADLVAGPNITSLTHLDLSAYGLDLRQPMYMVSDSGLGNALRCFPSLRYLNLSGTAPLGPSTLSSIATMGDLTHLNISHCVFCDATLAALRSLDRLESLFMSHTDVGPHGLSHIRQLTNLAHLDIAGCTEVTDEAVLELRHLTGLRFLSLSDCCELTDRGLQVLSSLRSLTTLNLGRYVYADVMQATDAGLAALRHLTNLTQLDLHESGDGVTDRGLGHLAELTTLTSLNIALCQGITDSGLLALRRLTGIVQLDIHSCRGISDEGIHFLTALTSLRQLNLSACRQLTDDGLGALQQLTSLQHLDMGTCCLLSDEGLAQLSSRLKHLTHLNLTRCAALSDRGISALRALTSLTHLNFRSCAAVTDTGLASLSPLTSLTYLDITDCHRITACGCAVLLRHRPRLEIDGQSKHRRITAE